MAVQDTNLYRRDIEKLAGGAVIDWNSGPVLKRIEIAVAKVNKRGALRVKRKARSIVRSRAYKTGDLYNTIKEIPSKHQSIKTHGKGYADWLIMAGDERTGKALYASAVEKGRYFKKAGTRIDAVPFMRQAASNTRKWLKPRMKAAIRQAIR